MRENHPMTVIFANDPGEKNSAYSVVEITPKSVKLLETGMITETIINLTGEARLITKSSKVIEPNLTDSVVRFKGKIEQVYRRWPITHHAAERFQTRGVKSRSTETVSTMNAISLLVAMNRGASIRLIIASQWKMWVNKLTDLDTVLYPLGAELGLSHHTIDTLCIAIYEYVTYLNSGLSLTPESFLKLIRMAANDNSFGIGVRSKVKALYADGNWYPALVEKVTPKLIHIRWNDGSGTARLPWEHVKERKRAA